MFDFSKNPNHLALLSEFVARACCIHLGEEKRYLFEARLGTVITESGARDIPEFIRMAEAESSGRLRDKIIDSMTTHETYWFRDTRPWEAMEKSILPKLASLLRYGKKTRIRILSAACSSGQEPYSIAMLLHKLKANGVLDGLNLQAFEIVGFDISPGTLFLASAGRYSQLEISRGLPEFWRNEYFEATPSNTWTLKPQVRSMVTFKKRNLQDDLTSLGLFDLVLCRNVAIYFENTFKERLFTRLAEVILPGGLLMLGGTESLLSHKHLFTMEELNGSFFYKRKP
ncbi:MAG: protein-glutamate O-methyltransferase CheR [bacterium]